MLLRGSSHCAGCGSCAHPSEVPDTGSAQAEQGCTGRGAAALPGQRVLPCIRSGRVPSEGTALRFLGWLRREKGCGWSHGGHRAAAPRAGALPRGRWEEPPGTEELAAEGTGGGKTGTQRREGCLQPMSCHFVSFKRVGFPLSCSAVRGGGSISPCSAPPRPSCREPARGGTGGPLGKAPISPSLPSPGALPATSALGARGLQAVQLICC